METASGPVAVTISVGMAVLGEPCNTLDKLLKCADQALYLAKERGRNRVCEWDRERFTGLPREPFRRLVLGCPLRLYCNAK